MGEQVLVVRREDIPKQALAQGFTSGTDKLPEVVATAFFMERDQVENDPTYKQLIPQIVVRNTKGEVFVVQRLRTQGEARLHGRHSIGIGGHINPIDTSTQRGCLDVIVTGLMRELDEELEADMDLLKSFRWLGTLNDDSNDVGKVHYGIVAMITFTDDAKVNVKEADKMTGCFMGIDEATKYYDNMERWSQFIFDYIKEG